MDICCASCGEPWDSHHLLFDEIHETDLPKHIRTDFTNGGGRLDEKTQPALEAMGWRFAGSSVLSFVRCPHCRPERILRNAVQRREDRAAIASILEGDMDAMLVSLADQQ